MTIVDILKLATLLGWDLAVKRAWGLAGDSAKSGVPTALR